jgi:hypothetical protein
MPVLKTACWTTDREADCRAMAAASPAGVPAAVCVFLPFAASVAGAFVLLAASALGLRSVGPVAGGPVPVAAGVADVPAPAWRIACFAAVDISRPA